VWKPCFCGWSPLLRNLVLGAWQATHITTTTLLGAHLSTTTRWPPSPAIRRTGTYDVEKSPGHTGLRPRLLGRQLSLRPRLLLKRDKKKRITKTKNKKECGKLSWRHRRLRPKARLAAGGFGGGPRLLSPLPAWLKYHPMTFSPFQQGMHLAQQPHVH